MEDCHEWRTESIARLLATSRAARRWRGARATLAGVADDQDLERSNAAAAAALRADLPAAGGAGDVEASADRQRLVAVLDPGTPDRPQGEDHGHLRLRK